jgi:hypothetical protein
MFLSKKNAVYFNKPKLIDPSKPKRVLAGNLHLNQDGKTMINKKITMTTLSKTSLKHNLSPVCSKVMITLISPMSRQKNNPTINSI